MASLGEMMGAGAVETFLGLPRGDTGDIVIFGADSATPYAWVGPYCAGGAAAIRAGSADYAGDLERVNFDLGGPILPAGLRAVDAGDVAFDDDAATMRQRIETRTRAILAAGGVPVVLGGDDSVPIPVLGAFDRPLSILQIDAHIDWRDTVRGERWGLSSTMRRASEMAHVGAIAQVGSRGVGSAGMAELEAARAYGATLVGAQKVLRGDGVARALAALPAGGDVFVALDLDALDPSVMPAVIAPTGGGLGYADVLALLTGAAARCRIAGLAIVEFKRDADVDGTGARCAAQLLTAALGLIGRQIAAAGGS